jgi:molybdopterin-guanine dinucleotide biosynthesis protein A
MGRDKAFLPGREKTLLEDTLKVLSGLFPEVLLSGGDPRLAAYGYRVLADEVPDQGPLGGLCTVLKAAAYDYVFLAACDLPLFSAAAVSELWLRGRETPGALAFIPKTTGLTHPLHAFYHRDLLPALEDNLRRGQLKMRQVFAAGSPADVLCLAPFTGELAAAISTNVNTPQEWAAARALFS